MSIVIKNNPHRYVLAGRLHLLVAQKAVIIYSYCHSVLANQIGSWGQMNCDVDADVIWRLAGFIFSVKKVD